MKTKQELIKLDKTELDKEIQEVIKKEDRLRQYLDLLLTIKKYNEMFGDEDENNNR